jgi:hypothetical protein
VEHEEIIPREIPEIFSIRFVGLSAKLDKLHDVGDRQAAAIDMSKAVMLELVATVRKAFIPQVWTGIPITDWHRGSMM